MIGFYYGGPNSSTKVFGIQSLDFDATLDELHEWKNEVTQNPVETGSPISDHVIEKSDKLRIQGVITNSPLRGEFAGQYFGGDTQSPRIQTAFEAIRELHKARDVVVVYTKHAIYTDMVIESVSIPRNAQIGEEMQFTMELVNIRLVETQMVTLPPGISPKKANSGKKAEPQKSTGQTMPRNLREAEAAKTKSILSSISK
ncbi:hypothetical protein UFOVP1309_38 [uncultured Caudovirales phage]|uniref:Dit-like phage tail protein N-terminal domain-containing protein n=1 Tax=uncultured Caudovirales phage TaxID=2100421 RepID=A0A6J5RW46_9CAUD|nr:hypothetical protein UFOVP1309_38 [uncultured Caudovirales phage]